MFPSPPSPLSQGGRGGVGGFPRWRVGLVSGSLSPRSRLAVEGPEAVAATVPSTANRRRPRKWERGLGGEGAFKLSHRCFRSYGTSPRGITVKFANWFLAAALLVTASVPALADTDKKSSKDESSFGALKAADAAEAQIKDSPPANSTANVPTTQNEKAIDAPPAAGLAADSGTKTTLQQTVTAATAVAERLTTAPTVAIVIARQDIKSVSDLAHRTIAFDERQSAQKGNARTALVAAGAQGVQLSESQTGTFDRVIGGEVPAGVLTLVSR